MKGGLEYYNSVFFSYSYSEIYKNTYFKQAENSHISMAAPAYGGCSRFFLGRKYFEGTFTSLGALIGHK